MEEIFLKILIWGAEHDIHWYLSGIVLLLMPVWVTVGIKLEKDLRGFIRRNHNGK